MNEIKAADLTQGLIIKSPSNKKFYHNRYGVFQTFPEMARVIAVSAAYDKVHMYVSTNATGPLSGSFSIPRTAVFEIASETETEKYEAAVLELYKKNLSEHLTDRDGMFSGCDPEIFVQDGNGKVIPAFEFLKPKTKDASLFWDGVQAEFTTPSKACIEEETIEVRKGLKRLLSAATKYNKDASILLADVVPVPITDLANMTDEQVGLGCAASKNAYKDVPELNVDDPRMLDIRFAGGHKHFGLQLTEEDAERIVKTLDNIWGVASVSMFEGLENPARRQFYGIAGEYRLPKHGLEYRVPSNAWLCHPGIMQFSWDLARWVVTMARRGMHNVWEGEEAETRSIINNLDVVAARKVIARNKNIYLAILNGCYAHNKPHSTQVGTEILNHGVISVLETSKDINLNWNLGSAGPPAFHTVQFSNLANRYLRNGKKAVKGLT